MDEKKYLLAIRKNHNVPDPVEWWLFPDYNGGKIDSLKDIDDFTSKISEEYLRNLLIESNMKTSEEITKQFIISHYENGAHRELDYGPCFQENSSFLTPYAVIEFIKQNINDKNLLNRIYNAFNKIMEKTPGFEDFLNAVNNLNTKNLRELNNLYYVDYLELRSLGMFISKILVPKLTNNIIPFPKSTNNDVKTVKKELIKEIA